MELSTATLGAARSVTHNVTLRASVPLHFDEQTSGRAEDVVNIPKLSHDRHFPSAARPRLILNTFQIGTNNPRLQSLHNKRENGASDTHTHTMAR